MSEVNICEKGQNNARDVKFLEKSVEGSFEVIRSKNLRKSSNFEASYRPFLRSLHKVSQKNVERSFGVTRGQFIKILQID